MMQNLFRYEEYTAYILALYTVIYISCLVLKRKILCLSLTKLDLAISLYCIYIVVNIGIVEESRIELTTICKWMAVIMIYILMRCFEKKKLILLALVLSGVAESITAICQKLDCLESQHTNFEVTGHLGNPGPLGGYLSVCFIVCFYFLCITWQSKRRWMLIMSIVSCVITMSGIILSDSRAAVLGLLIGGFYLIYTRNIVIIRQHWFKIICVSCFAFILCLALMYQYRPLSANARLLVWRVSTNMLADRPLIGHGIGSFSWKYMLYQASYFEKKKDMSEVMVADNVAYTYNELLHLTVETGIMGLLFACLIMVLIYYENTLDIFQLIIKTGFTIWIIFSTFSYSTEVLPLLFLLPLLLGCLKSKTLFTYTIHSGVKCMIIILCLTICINAIRIGKTYHELSSRIAMLSKEKYENVTELVDAFYPMLKNNIKFNLIYSKWLSKQTMHLQQRLEQMKLIIPTCENYCLLGDYYRKMKRFTEAEKCYMVASNMVPTRMRPNYKLWSLYLQVGNNIKAVAIARYILQQPIKVENSFTINVKSEITRFLSTN